MSRRDRVIRVIMIFGFCGLSGYGHTRELRGAEPRHSEGAIVIPTEAKANSYTIANRHIMRLVDISGDHLVTKQIGSRISPLTVTGGDEFAIVIGPEKKRITAGDFRVASIKPAQGELNVVLQNAATGLLAEVKYWLTDDDFYLRKTIRFRNEGAAPVQILDIDVESLRFGKARALGLGKPVYAEGKLFLGLEFPLGHNQQEDGLVTLRHLPGKTLQPKDSLASRTAVVGTASQKEPVEAAFDRYIRQIALRKPEVMTVYGNWARYDYISDGVFPDEKMVFETVEQLSKMQAAGWRPDYYVMDAGWFDKKGDYTDYVKPAWPNGPAPMVKAIKDIGMKYGLWFDVGGGIPDNPAVQPSKYSGDRMCMAPGPYISTFQKALVEQIEHLGLTMIKFDFALFDCNSDRHGHLVGEYGTEASLTGFLDMLDSIRTRHPQVKYIIFNGFHRSPWWLMHVDTIYSNDPAPWDIPSLRLRDSIDLKTDKSVHEHRFDHLLPWYTIDDCGLMIGRTGTIYWIGAEEFRKAWVLNIGRGNMMPFIYGDLRLLDEADRRFIAKMWNVLRDNAEVFADTRLVVGRANGAEVFGYSHFKGEHGFVFLSNPTFEQKAVVLKLDSSLGLSISSKSPLSVTELFPVECTYATEDKVGFKPGGGVHVELAPFEVRALEIKPSGGVIAHAVPPRQSASRSISIPVQLVVRSPEWLTDSMMDKANKEQFHLGVSTGAKVETPKSLVRTGLKGIYSFTLQMPVFDSPRILAMPLRFMAGHKPVRSTRPTTCALAAGWCDDKQVLLNTTPEYGRNIWSGCSWLTFHVKLDPSFSGKKIDMLALNLSMEGVGIEMEKVYLLEDALQIL